MPWTEDAAAPIVGHWGWGGSLSPAAPVPVCLCVQCLCVQCPCDCACAVSVCLCAQCLCDCACAVSVCLCVQCPCVHMLTGRKRSPTRWPKAPGCYGEVLSGAGGAGGGRHSAPWAGVLAWGGSVGWAPGWQPASGSTGKARRRLGQGATVGGEGGEEPLPSPCAPLPPVLAAAVWIISRRPAPNSPRLLGNPPRRFVEAARSNPDSSSSLLGGLGIKQGLVFLHRGPREAGRRLPGCLVHPPLAWGGLAGARERRVPGGMRGQAGFIFTL